MTEDVSQLRAKIELAIELAEAELEQALAKAVQHEIAKVESQGFIVRRVDVNFVEDPVVGKRWPDYRFAGVRVEIV